MEKIMHGSIRNLIGQRFGRLLVLGDSGKRQGCVVWTCLCTCGNFKEIRGGSMIQGRTRSCGCLSDERRRRTKHGHTVGAKRTKLYQIWKNMRHRCQRGAYPSYHCYGGRGISVCEEWQYDFVAFKDWALASGYREPLTIDRIDNNGNYKPSNCQWLTKSENSKKPKNKTHGNDSRL